ncbi:MAG TPA: glycosyltransferase [Paracoccaceae bacterium]|nr:glycosyltransferase [Paracoccaceae bacterium]HMO70681.1 glycosyltransferase [Paracoccaceae bacterium]
MTVIAPFPGPRRPPALPAGAAPALPASDALAGWLAADGVVPRRAVLQALAQRQRHGGRLVDILLARGMVAEGALYAAMSRHWHAAVIDPAALPPDPGLSGRMAAADSLSRGLLPWRRVGGRVVVLTAYPDDFAAERPGLEAVFGPVTMGLAPSRRIEAVVLALHGPALAEAAAARLPSADSCRGLSDRGRLRAAALALSGLAAGLALAPGLLLAALSLWGALALVALLLLKLAAAIASSRPAPPPPPAPEIARLPVVSLIVALYGEAGIAPRLVRRLEALDWPRDRLDVVIAVETDDAATRAALAGAGLPAWMRVVTVPPVPPGSPRTKPRALNYALTLCRGSIIGIYDAEDAPAPDQIRRVVGRFHTAPPRVACLQGVLDFYNPRQNALSRLFTLDYAAWFRVVLPGLSRLGLPLPLGGTTLFFRRAALEEVGAWDAWNVTEDADLGIRLHRRGWRTELIDSVTLEEANCRAWPWVRQRSRWLKGYMLTWAVHMRRPAALWRDLGPKGFLGFQILFLGSLSQFVLAPLLWSFWIAAMGLPHPAGALPAGVLMAFVVLFLAAEGASLAVFLIGLSRRGGGVSRLWVPMLSPYFLLGALASYKALAEVALRPFFWDKTAHGLSPQAMRVAGTRPRGTAAAALSTARRLHPLILDRPALPAAPDDPTPVQRVRNSPASTRRRVS